MSIEEREAAHDVAVQRLDVAAAAWLELHAGGRMTVAAEVELDEARQDVKRAAAKLDRTRRHAARKEGGCSA